MNKSLFAAIVAASLAPAHTAGAQMQTGQVYGGSQTMNQSYGNLQNIRNRRELERKYGARRAPGEAQADYGRRLIEGGRASVRFTPRPMPVAQLIKVWAKTNPRGQAGARAEWQTQSALWNQQVKARHAHTNNMGDVYALAVVMCFETYSGKRVSQAGYARQAREFAHFFNSLAFYQGYNTREKQDLAETAMLSASDALRLRRAGKIAEAREGAAEFLNSWATGKLPGIQKALAPYSSGA